MGCTWFMCNWCDLILDLNLNDNVHVHVSVLHEIETRTRDWYRNVHMQATCTYKPHADMVMCAAVFRLQLWRASDLQASLPFGWPETDLLYLIKPIRSVECVRSTYAWTCVCTYVYVESYMYMYICACTYQYMYKCAVLNTFMSFVCAFTCTYTCMVGRDGLTVNIHLTHQDEKVHTRNPFAHTMILLFTQRLCLVNVRPSSWWSDNMSD